MDEQTRILEQVDKLVSAIQEEKCYQDVLLIQEEMKENQDLLLQIDGVKKLQQEWVKTRYQDTAIEEKLLMAKKELETIPLYRSYLEKLEEVNGLVTSIEEKLNFFFEEICK